MKLAGRHVLITGAAAGIGRATAELFLREGAAVAMLDRREDDLRKAARVHDRAVPIPCDVAVTLEVDRAVAEAVSALGALDGIVNAAGVDLIQEFGAMTPNDWHRVIAVNLTGPMLICRAALPLAADGATIVNVASAAGLRPLPARTAYCASKGGLVMFTKALALEIAPRGVRANVICPGIIDTAMLRSSYESAPNSEAAYREIVSRTAMGRVGQVDDIAHAALYLSGDESGFVTGSTLVVDGGRVFH